MMTLNDGRAELWQWDTGRTLAVDADCSQVHFSNKVFGRSIDVDVIEGTAVIPDILLQTDKDLNVWAFVGTADNGYTKISKTFKVNRRNKPSDYVFTPQEQITLKDATAILEEAKDVANHAMESAKQAEDSSTQAAKRAGAADNRATDAENAAKAAASSAAAAKNSAIDAASAAKIAGDAATKVIEESVADKLAQMEDIQTDVKARQEDVTTKQQQVNASVELARQAATANGYIQMGVDPDTGHLLYTRTTNIKDTVNFDIVNDTNLEVTIHG